MKENDLMIKARVNSYVNFCRENMKDEASAFILDEIETKIIECGSESGEAIKRLLAIIDGLMAVHAGLVQVEAKIYGISEIHR